MYDIVLWIPVIDIDEHSNELKDHIKKYLHADIHVRDVKPINEINQYCEQKCIVSCDENNDASRIIYVDTLKKMTPTSDIYVTNYNGHNVYIRNPPELKRYVLLLEPIVGQDSYFATIAKTPYRSLTNIKADVTPIYDYTSDKPYTPMKDDIRNEQYKFINQLYNNNIIFGLRKDYKIIEYNKGDELECENVYAVNIDDVGDWNGLIFVANYHLPMEVLFIRINTYAPITENDKKKLKSFLTIEEAHARYFYEYTCE